MNKETTKVSKEDNMKGRAVLVQEAITETVDIQLSLLYGRLHVVRGRIMNGISVTVSYMGALLSMNLLKLGSVVQRNG